MMNKVAMLDKLSPLAFDILIWSFNYPNYVNSLGDSFEWNEYVFPTLSQINETEAKVLYAFRGDCYDWTCNTLLEFPREYFGDIENLKESLELFKAVGSKPAAELLTKLTNG